MRVKNKSRVKFNSKAVGLKTYDKGATGVVLAVHSEAENTCAVTWVGSNGNHFNTNSIRIDKLDVIDDNTGDATEAVFNAIEYHTEALIELNTYVRDEYYSRASRLDDYESALNLSSIKNVSQLKKGDTLMLSGVNSKYFTDECKYTVDTVAKTGNIRFAANDNGRRMWLNMDDVEWVVVSRRI